MLVKLARLGVAIFALLGLAGCGISNTRAEQPIKDGYAALEPSLDIGQTFTSSYDGLQGVVVYIEPVDKGSGEIILHLRRDSLTSNDLRTARLGLENVSKAGPYTFKFSPIQNSFHMDYYLLLELQGEGKMLVGSGGAQTYQNGSLYQNGEPQTAQLYFGLSYQIISLIAGLAKEAARWGGWTLIGIFLYLLPGWALLSALWPGWEEHAWGEKLGLGGGVSLALSPVLLLLANGAGVQPGIWSAILPGAIGAVYLLWKNRPALRRAGAFFRAKKWGEVFRAPIRRITWSASLLVGVILLVLFTRFWAIRSIAVPMWGDSVQHTVMAQLIVDHGGLFTSWEPYTPYQSLTVHFGFPTHVALFAWLTALLSEPPVPSYTSALIVAQIVNAMAVIALLPLAYRLSRGNNWAAAGVLIAAGLLSSVPASYVNWGRFAQLDGQAILPAGVWLTWDLLDRMRGRSASSGKTEKESPPTRLAAFSLADFWIPGLVIGLTLAGMTLSYYRMAFYYITIFPGLFLAWLLAGAYSNWRPWITSGLSIAVVGGATLLFLLPWLGHVTGSHLSGMVAEGMTGGIAGGSAASVFLQEMQQWGEMGAYLPPALAVLAAAAFLLSLVLRRWEVAAVGLWVVFIQAYDLSRVIHLPGANMLQTFAILVWLYVPAGLLVGWLVGEVAVLVQSSFPRSGQIALTVILLPLAFYGANKARQIDQPAAYNMVTQPDLRAMTWIRQNTPAEVKFLVEGSLIYNGLSIVGSDAGWWIPLLAGRQNTMPPQYALLNETPNTPGYSQRLVDLVAALTDAPVTDPQVIDLICAEGVTHVFIGQKMGSVGYGFRPLFSPSDFLSQPEFTLEYHQDGVYIFSLNRAFCTQR